MYCQKCGNLIVDGEKFCRSCGTPARIQAGPVPEQQQKKKPGAASIIFPIVFATVVIIGAIIAISNLKASHESDESSSSAPVAETGVTPTPVAPAPVADTEPETAPPPAAVETDWRTIYLTYVLDNSRGGVFSGFKLVFIDDDDIPELVADSGRYPSGLVVMTIHNGEIIEYSGISDLSYIEKSGLICSEGGISGYYPVSVIELKNGKFTEIYSATIGEDRNENDEFYEIYHIGEKEVTKSEFDSELKKHFDKGKSLTVRDFISRDEIMKVL